MLSHFAGRVLLGAVLLLQGGPTIPSPQGLVNDFANVLPPASAARMERIAQDVRDKSKGEIAIVTLADLAGRDPSDIALRIGREWKVGNMAATMPRSPTARWISAMAGRSSGRAGRITSWSYFLGA